jgi:pimeloyl-ACP methyl ester carboxylesterase
MAVSDELLLIHGLGASASVWDPVLPLLEEERQVVVLDMPGFGTAPPLAEGVEPTAANLGAALAERLAALGIERPHVAGNSLGAWVGLEMGRAGTAASVTAISPAGLWRKPLGARRHEPRAWARKLRPLVRGAVAVPALRRRMTATFAYHPEKVPRATAAELIMGWVDANGYEGANRAMRTYIFDPEGYPEDVPVTIAWGEYDRLVGPPKEQRRPAGARFLVLPGVGHTPMWDDPELVARTLLEGSDTLALTTQAKEERS